MEREADFDRIEITAEVDAQRFRTDFNVEPLHAKLYNPLHTPEDHKLEMRVNDV